MVSDCHNGSICSKCSKFLMVIDDSNANNDNDGNKGQKGPKLIAESLPGSTRDIRTMTAYS